MADKVSMGKFSWQEEYSVGVEKLDLQHKHLFEFTNKLLEQSSGPVDLKLVTETLAEMVKYAKEHFADEESLMKKYHYLGIDAQEKQHTYFIDTVAEMSLSVANNGQSAAYELAEFLKLWLANHVIKVDMKYKDFFRQKLSEHKTAAV